MAATNADNLCFDLMTCASEVNDPRYIKLATELLNGCKTEQDASLLVARCCDPIEAGDLNDRALKSFKATVKEWENEKTGFWGTVKHILTSYSGHAAVTRLAGQSPSVLSSGRAPLEARVNIIQGEHNSRLEHVNTSPTAPIPQTAAAAPQGTARKSRPAEIPATSRMRPPKREHGELSSNGEHVEAADTKTALCNFVYSMTKPLQVAFPPPTFEHRRGDCGLDACPVMLVRKRAQAQSAAEAENSDVVIEHKATTTSRARKDPATPLSPIDPRIGRYARDKEGRDTTDQGSNARSDSSSRHVVKPPTGPRNDRRIPPGSGHPPTNSSGLEATDGNKANKKRANEDATIPQGKVRRVIATTVNATLKCGSCKNRGTTCDMKAKCGKCAELDVMCVYHPCAFDDKCSDATCTRMHPDQASNGDANGAEYQIQGYNVRSKAPRSQLDPKLTGRY